MSCKYGFLGRWPHLCLGSSETRDCSADRTYEKLSSHLISSDQRENIPSYNP